MYYVKKPDESGYPKPYPFESIKEFKARQELEDLNDEWGLEAKQTDKELKDGTEAFGNCILDEPCEEA